MAGIHGHGAELRRGDGESPEVFTAIGEVANISGPGLEREEHDVTTHGSPDGWREFVGGLKDAGEVELEVRYDPSEHDSLVADFEDTDPRNYELVFPDTDSTTWEFTALLTGFEPSAPHDDILEASITFKLSGKPTLSSLGA